VEEFLHAHDEDAVTARLDELADELGGGSGVGVGRRLLDSGTWRW